MSELADPLTRLTFLPTAMNWRGEWNNAFQYFKNDVATSPTNNASYLLFGATADRGVDPVSNADWFQVFPHTTGLEGLTAGNGISIAPVPSANNPTISNSGVRSLTANTGLSTFGGQQPLVFNTGVLGIVADPSSTSGLSWTPSTSTLLNAGLVSAFTLGITNSGTPQTQVWSNAGIIGLTAGTNISVSVDSSGTATIGNTGILALNAGANITRGGNTATPTITLNNIDVNTLLSPTAGMTPNPIAGFPLPLPPLPLGTGFVPVSLPVGNPLVPMLTNPPSDPNPTWVFDFGGWWVESPAVQGISLGLIMGFRDNATAGGPYNYLSDYNVWMSEGFSGQLARANGGLVVAPLHSLRSAGFKTITDVAILNQTGNPLTLQSWSPVLATYYANYSV
jgi:hypothetical protein